jgi:hypothetical protein
MNIFGKVFLLVSLFFTSFNTESECKVFSDQFVIGTSITAGVTCATILGLYLWMHRAPKKVAPQNEAERLLQKVDDDNDEEAEGALSKILKLTLIPGAVGGGLYYVLSGYTFDGYLKYCQRHAKKVNLGLGEKFSDSRNRLVKGIENKTLEKFVNSNFGKDSQCPLIEAAMFLVEQRELLQGAVKALDELNDEIASNNNIISDVQKREKIYNVSEDIQNLSDKISDAVEVIKKSSDYKDQLTRFIAYRKQMDKKEAVSSQRKYELLKILAIGGVASGIAGKLVAPFN